MKFIFSSSTGIDHLYSAQAPGKTADLYLGCVKTFDFKNIFVVFIQSKSSKGIYYISMLMHFFPHSFNLIRRDTL